VIVRYDDVPEPDIASRAELEQMVATAVSRPGNAG
jgi:hypothetical protein